MHRDHGQAESTHRTALQNAAGQHQRRTVVQQFGLVTREQRGRASLHNRIHCHPVALHEEPDVDAADVIALNQEGRDRPATKAPNLR